MTQDSHPAPTENASIDCGWGRLIFGNTFDDPKALATTLAAEQHTRRDIAFYVEDPQVVLAEAPQELFLDPSISFRLDLTAFEPAEQRLPGLSIRRLTTERDAEAINTIYAAHGMVEVPPHFFWSNRDARAITVLVAEEDETGTILGTVMGVDHKLSWGDPDHGASLWCLAVSPHARYPGIGKALVRRLAEEFRARGATTMDLSVLHDNSEAMKLYEKLGFERFQAFTIKRKNPINEPLFVGDYETDGLNPYAQIIVKEARRRGIFVEVIDAEAGLFELQMGGRRIKCREALSELTSAVAMSICDDKRVTRRIVSAAGVRTAEQAPEDSPAARAAFLAEHGAVVVKPARGEMGDGVSVDLRTPEEVEAAVERARNVCSDIIVESYLDGEDLRLVVIDYKVVAAAIRRRPMITGDGTHTARELIETQSRRRAAQTGGESTIPCDAETERCLAMAGFGYDDVVPKGTEVTVRKTANLHTGGLILDVTEETHPALIDAAIKCARAIGIPVTGIDFIVRSPRQSDYIFIEANERPGLANHEPQPTAQRFIDLLFPMTVASEAAYLSE
ncbi:N-acetylglutaminylglutamine synthetase [Tropicimonas sp. IMCC6043]|uniref:N-acetylglutaminylglutamine synthetase n=1 Tax=Tropicimonas sp. IMCC6043 TaxID=2510645 RepID=UPI00101C20E3|nr:N-acetylglutaminylglutamine synthetase [Tropicimonas sp. IMCC6043]RYH11557.1 N-acetylglutaminylglutamine synthetase [Tropicimonas sp. IMCC6043]